MQAKSVLNGKEINLTGDNTIIKSNNFNVDKNGNMTCSNATITGGKINIHGEGDTKDLLRIIEQNNTSHFSYMQPRGAGFVYGNSEKAVYIFAGETSIVSVSDNNGITDVTGSGIKTPVLTQTSLAEYKKNFEKLQDNALDIIKGIDIYKYNLKNEKDNNKKHIGFVIGDNYNYAKEITNIDNTGVDTYSFISLCCKAIQEQQKQIEELKIKIREVEEYGNNRI